MTITPIGSVTSTPVALPPSPYVAADRVATAASPPAAEPAELGATAAQTAQGAGYVLYGESGLVIQSEGAIALISPAALLYANAALAPAQPRPLVPPVAPVQPVARVADNRAAGADA